MQIRILRITAEKYGLSLKQAAELFEAYNVLPFIRKCFGIFHVEGDEAVSQKEPRYEVIKIGNG